MQSAPSAWKLDFKHASHILTSEPLYWLFSLPAVFFPHVLLLISLSPILRWSMPSTQGPPGSPLQCRELGLLLVAVKENAHGGEVWASQYGGVREDLQGVDLIWSDPSWSQSGLV